MCAAGPGPDRFGAENADSGTSAAFAALLEDDPAELYETAPCGYLSTLMDGTIAKLNSTLLDWLGLEAAAVVGRLAFTDILSVGSRLYHETHYAPLLRMRGEVSGIAMELKTPDGGRLPVLVSAAVKFGADGQPLLIRTTLVDATDRRSYEKELLHRRKEAEQARERAEEARRAAEADRRRLADALAVLQRSLMPDTLPEIPGLEADSYYHTASPFQLGGDFYDLFPLDGRRWAFFLGDVCGKGPEAASLTSLTRYTLRAAALHDPAPTAALATLNALLYGRYTSSGDPRYCSAVFGVVEPGPSAGRVSVRIASGGHPPALVLRSDGTAEFLRTTGGMIVGILPEAPFVSATTELGPGDTLLLYTDGLTEARTGTGRGALFGEEALQAFAAAKAPAGPRALIAGLTELLHGFGEGLGDDTALLALGVPAPAPSSPAGPGGAR